MHTERTRIGSIDRIECGHVQESHQSFRVWRDLDGEAALDDVLTPFGISRTQEEHSRILIYVLIDLGAAQCDGGRVGWKKHINEVRQSP